MQFWMKRDDIIPPLPLRLTEIGDAWLARDLITRATLAAPGTIYARDLWAEILRRLAADALTTDEVVHAIRADPEFAFYHAPELRRHVALLLELEYVELIRQLEP